MEFYTDNRSLWTIISKELSSLDGLPFQQRSKVFAVTVIKKNEVFVVAFDERIISVYRPFHCEDTLPSLKYRR